MHEEVTEVSRDYALIKFSQAPTEDMKILPIPEVIDEFHCQDNEVLLIDGGLL